MIISHEHKFIFVHVVRTGGTSVEKVLLKYGESYAQHMKFYQIKEQFEGFYNPKHDPNHVPVIDLTDAHEFKDYFKFLFVRNVPEWLVSIYLYNHRHLPRRRPFIEAVSAWCTDQPTPGLPGYDYWKTMYDQHRFALDKNGIMIPDFVGCTESLQDDFNIVCDRIGIPREELPRLNGTHKPKPWRQFFTDGLKDTVEDKWSLDIQLFGIDWDGLKAGNQY
jgi:hypothetical protein